MESSPFPWTGQSDATEAGFATAFEEMEGLIQSYHEASIKLYHGNPEALSAARLTILELWVRMDISAVKLVPLLRQYYHGFRPGLFDSLVLPKTQ